MPRNEREYLLRYADQAIAAQDKTLSKLQQIAEKYGETHPEHKKHVELIATAQVQVQSLLNDFRQQNM